MRYVKTDQGRAALQSRDPAMPSAMRHVLILCDGKRTEQDLAALLPAETLQQALEQLIQKGLLLRAQGLANSTPGPSSQFAPASASTRPLPTRPAPLSVPQSVPAAAAEGSAPPPLANDPDRFRKTVTLLTGFAAELGFTARFKAQLAIERANTLDELVQLADDLLVQLHERGKVTPTMRSQVQALRQGYTPQP